MPQNTSTNPGPVSASASSSISTLRDDTYAQLETNVAMKQTHARTQSSMSDEFGSFVYVPASDDPLGAVPASAPTMSPLTPSIFDAFVGDAKQRSRDNEKRVMDELRKHEEDPLAWLKSDCGEARAMLGSDNSTVSNPKTMANNESPLLHDAPLAETGVRDSEIASEVDKDLLLLESPSASPRKTRLAPTDRTAAPASDLLSGLSGDEPLGVSASSTEAGSTTASEVFSKSRVHIYEGPKERAERNGKRILEELRARDEDPLGWLQPKDDTDDVISSALKEAGSTLIDLNTPSNEAPPEPPPRSPTPSVSSDSLISPSPRPVSLPRAITSPLIPRSPDRARSQSPSQRVPTSPSLSSNIGSTTSPLSRSWMSTLGLFGASRAAAASSSSSAAHGTHDSPSIESGAAGLSPTQSTLHALFMKASAAPPSPKARRHSRFATEGHPPAHAATMPLPSAPAGSSDASPFASHAYIPPSGAPGFTGDHNWNPAGFEFDTRKNTDGKKVKLVGRNDITVPVLDSTIASALRSHLPPLSRLTQSWKLLYSADQHGLSLNTLYARCTPPTIVGGGGIIPGTAVGALLAVQDAEGGVFGAWIPEGVHLSHGSYYGGGDSFLWSVDKKDIKSEDDIRVYKWTGRNGYVAYCDTDGFSFGGGDGYYGLYIDASLVEGTTHACPTFDNECLAHGERKGRMIAFDAVGLEVWGISS